MARSLKAAEERILYETETRGWREQLGSDPLSGMLFMRVKKQDFYDSLAQEAQLSYNQGIGVIWPFNDPLVEIVGGREAIRETLQEAATPSGSPEPALTLGVRQETPRNWTGVFLVLAVALLLILFLSLIDS